MSEATILTLPVLKNIEHPTNGTHWIMSDVKAIGGRNRKTRWAAAWIMKTSACNKSWKRLKEAKRILKLDSFFFFFSLNQLGDMNDVSNGRKIIARDE